MAAQEVIEYAVAQLTLPGQSVNGDRHLVMRQNAGVVAAVVDGLGHGSEAALAAEAALQTLGACLSGDVPLLLRRCHESLRGTRGAVMTVASFDPSSATMSWFGVGNVEGILVRPVAGTSNAEKMFVRRRAGVVGQKLPPLRPATMSLQPEDTVILATDGISGEFFEAPGWRQSPQKLADHLLSRYALGTDDALLLVIRWLGAEHA
jgi:serine phosphatase RsbU (regulator of sigma subunit)